MLYDKILALFLRKKSERLYFLELFNYLWKLLIFGFNSSKIFFVTLITILRFFKKFKLNLNIWSGVTKRPLLVF
jgi:hypothetical protein